MRLRLIYIYLLLAASLLANENPSGEVFLSARIQWCETDKSKPWCSKRDNSCKMTSTKTYIESICTYEFAVGNSLDDDEWIIIISGPDILTDPEVSYPSGDYFFYLGKTILDDGSTYYDASWNGDKKSTKAQWPLGENFTLTEGYPPNGKVGNTGRYTIQNPNAEFVLDFTIPKIVSKIDQKNEFRYYDLVDYLNSPYTNAEYTLNTLYMTLVLDDKIDELLEARIEANAKWVKNDYEGFGPNWAELNKRILETQEAWEEYAKRTARERLAVYQGGSGAPSSYNTKYIQKQIERINELKVKLK